MRMAVASVAVLSVVALAVAVPSARVVIASDEEAFARAQLADDTDGWTLYVATLQAAMHAESPRGLVLAMTSGPAHLAAARSEIARLQLEERLATGGLIAACAARTEVTTDDARRSVEAAIAHGGEALRGVLASHIGEDDAVWPAYAAALDALDADPCRRGLHVHVHHEPGSGVLATAAASDDQTLEQLIRDPFVGLTHDFGFELDEPALGIDVELTPHPDGELVGIEGHVPAAMTEMVITLTPVGGSALTFREDVHLPIAFGIEVGLAGAAHAADTMGNALQRRALERVLVRLGLSEDDPVERRVRAMIEQSTGTEPRRVGAWCAAIERRVRSAVIDGLDVTWQIDCDDRRLYGAIGGTGFGRSWSPEWPPGVVALDEQTSSYDEDPALRIDFATRTLELRDDESALGGAMTLRATIVDHAPPAE